MTSANSPSELTTLLADARADVAGARERLLRTVLPALRQIAASLMAGERSWHTLQPTALVHEVFIRLFLERQVDWENRQHFFFSVGREMRYVLIAHARAHLAKKRGGFMIHEDLNDHPGVGGDENDLVEAIAVHVALDQLEKLDSRAARVVELRFFSGLTIDEVGALIGVSPQTVLGDWTFARTWLKQRLGSP